jgi:hypothetical protein
MSDHRIIGLTAMKDTAPVVEAAAAHYDALYQGLVQASANLESAFKGGFGRTGHYQGRLERFSEVWQGVFADFIKDEKALVRFLQDLHALMVDSHKVWQEVEFRNEMRFRAIAESLDESGA